TGNLVERGDRLRLGAVGKALDRALDGGELCRIVGRIDALGHANGVATARGPLEPGVGRIVQQAADDRLVGRRQSGKLSLDCRIQLLGSIRVVEWLSRWSGSWLRGRRTRLRR